MSCALATDVPATAAAIVMAGGCHSHLELDIDYFLPISTVSNFFFAVSDT